VHIYISTSVTYSGGLRLKFCSDNLTAILPYIYSGLSGKWWSFQIGRVSLTPHFKIIRIILPLGAVQINVIEGVMKFPKKYIYLFDPEDRPRTVRTHSRRPLRRIPNSTKYKLPPFPLSSPQIHHA
jgi:hypothetical protein